MSGQPPECKANEVYWPPLPGDHTSAPQPGTCPKGALDPVAKAEYPMVCADFCDAWAYCKWAGKRLCRSLDHPAGGVLTLESGALEALMKSERHEWTYACTQGGKTKWPYGDEFEAGTCIDKTRYAAGGPDALRAANLEGETCHGTEPPYSDIYHMSASVAEWVNACDKFECALEGGAFGMEPNSCVEPATAWSGEIARSYGIRCCADLE